MLVVDASVVAKWFLDEPLRPQARHLLEYQQELLAPDFVLVEIANVAWKKLRRGEITSDHAREIIASTPDAIPELISATQILAKATELAIELDHPVYDCLYLACLHEPHDRLVTGDKRFFNKTRNTRFENQVRYLDDPDLALPLFISLHSIEHIIALSERMQKTHRNLVAKLTEDRSIYNATELRPLFDSPTYRRLKESIEDLSEVEQVDILALGWLGRGYEQQSWGIIRERAENSIRNNGDHFLQYVASMAIYVGQGLAALRNTP